MLLSIIGQAINFIEGSSVSLCVAKSVQRKHQSYCRRHLGQRKHNNIIALTSETSEQGSMNFGHRLCTTFWAFTKQRSINLHVHASAKCLRGYFESWKTKQKLKWSDLLGSILHKKVLGSQIILIHGLVYRMIHMNKLVHVVVLPVL